MQKAQALLGCIAFQDWKNRDKNGISWSAHPQSLRLLWSLLVIKYLVEIDF